MICNILLFCVHGRACHVDETRRSGCATRVVRVTCVRGRISSVRQSSVVSPSARARPRDKGRVQPTAAPTARPAVYRFAATLAPRAAGVGTRCRWHLNTRGDYTRARGPLSSLQTLIKCTKAPRFPVFRRRHCNHHCHHCCRSRTRAIHVHTHARNGIHITQTY